MADVLGVDWKNRSYWPPFTVYERPCLSGWKDHPL